MVIGIPREVLENEKRVAALPETVAKYREMGFQVLVETTAGVGALRSDDEYREAGAEVVEDKEAVFRPFVSRRPGGTGLGLAIVRQIVENHKGTIRETGKVGEGARFEIELPALPDEEMSDEGAGD